MEKFFKILYYYVLFLLVFFVAYLSLVLTISPKKDAQKRGFIPCTETFVTEVSDCMPGSIGCTFRCLWKDTKCNATVVLNGFGAWLNGLQSRPWSNYLFEPAEDMSDLQQKRDMMEKTHQVAEDEAYRQLNLNPEMIMFDHDGQSDVQESAEEKTEDLGGIADEVLTVEPMIAEEKKDEK